MESALLVAAIVMLVGYSIGVTALVVRSDLLETRQKIGQVVLVWLLPLLGALAVHLINRAQEPSSPRSRSGLADQPMDHGVSPRDFSSPGHD